MAKRFADLLAGLGSRIFGLLSGWEEGEVRSEGAFGEEGEEGEGGLEEGWGRSRVARWLKISILGALVALIAACAKKSKPDDGLVTCYIVAQMDVNYSEVSAQPNPTEGAHWVKIKAKVGVTDTAEGARIRDAWLQFGADTGKVKFRPADGRFSDTVEIISARIDVSGLEPGTTWLYLTTTTSKGGYGSYSLPLEVSDKESK